jgi:hypothetical protein
VDGILGHNLLLSQAFHWESLRGWDLGFHGAFFSQTVVLFKMEFWLSGSPSHELFPFFTMEFWLSGSLSYELFLFPRLNSGYQGAFLTNFFLFSRWNYGY